MATGKIGPEGAFQHFRVSNPSADEPHYIGNRSDGSVVSWGYPTSTGASWPPSEGEVADILAYGGLFVDAASHYSYLAKYSQSYTKKECDAMFTNIFGDMMLGVQGSNAYAQGGKDYTSSLIRSGYSGGAVYAMAFCGIFGHHSVTVQGNGNLACCGRNDYHQCGPGDSIIYMPDVEPEPGPFLYAGAGRDFTVAIRQDGTLWVMGRNDVGQCGIPNMSEITELTLVETSEEWVHVSCGVDHTLLLNKWGQLWGMGGNSAGQLGLGHNNNVFEPVRLNGYIFDCVAAGYNFSVGFTKDKRWYGWGSNSHGQLSLGSIGSSYNTPQLGTIDISADNGSRVKWISCGAYHTACITNASSQGYVYACGDNTYGQCANGLVDDDPINPDPPITTIQQCVSLEHPDSGNDILRSDAGEGTTALVWIMVECGTYHTIVFNQSYDVRAFTIGRNDAGQCDTTNVSRDTSGRWTWDVEEGVMQNWIAGGDDYSLILINE